MANEILEPLYILAAAPRKQNKLNKLFETGAGSIIELLQKPYQLRYAGWDLETSGNPQIVRGEYLEAQIEGTKTIRVYEDGSFIVSVTAGPNFLSWPLNNETFIKEPRLNSLAITELTYLFVVFYSNLIKHFAMKPDVINMKASLKNAFIGDKHIFLVPYELETWGWKIARERFSASKNEMIVEVDVSALDIENKIEYVAFNLLEKVYNWFGVRSNQIPYTSVDEKQERFIDIKKFERKK